MFHRRCARLIAKLSTCFIVLIGGVVTSTQADIEQGLSELHSIDGVATRDIQNTASYSAKSTSVGIGTGMIGKNLGVSGVGAGVGKDSGSASSTTQAAISGIAGNKHARTGDAETGIKPIFDQDKARKEIEAQAAITQMFGREASKAIGDYAASQMKEAEALRQQANAEADLVRKAQLIAQATQLESDWGDTGALRIAAHALVGGLTGNAAGAAGAAVGTISAPVVAHALNAAGVDGALASVITGIASTAAGAAVGGSAGGAAALNEVANNFLAHQENLARKQAVIDCAKGDAAACAQRDKLNALDKARDDALRAACQADGASQACSQWIAYAKAAEATYGGTPDNASLREELRFGMYSDAAERREIQRLINSTPHAQPIGPQGHAALAALANIALDLTPVVGDIKGFAEAETPFDYTLALIGALGPAGDAAKALVKEAKALMDAGDAVSAVDKLGEAERSVAAIAGAKGKWSTQLNGKLEPSTVYKLDNGHAYVTDPAGRVKSVEGELILGRMDRNTYQQCATGKCGEAGDEGGHLIAAALGGAGDRINLIPQSQLLNRGDWRSMEREFQNALKEGKSVNVRIEVGYPTSTSSRPDAFKVTAVIDGKRIEKLFEQ